MTAHPIVSREEWLEARTNLLQKEKEFTKLRDELTRQRRALPWEKIEKEYHFQGSSGKHTLPDLFDGCSQLIVYHFMFGPDWTEGCKSCSMVADHYDPLIIHLRQRDVALATVSRAPIDQLEGFKKRMGWTFPWFSSAESDFSRDFHVAFSKEEIASGQTYYNYRERCQFPLSDGPGISSFFKDPRGEIFHTYSSYGRGLESFLGIYSFLDIVTKGRNEGDLPYPMDWIRHHDRYGELHTPDGATRNREP